MNERMTKKAPIPWGAKHYAKTLLAPKSVGVEMHGNMKKKENNIYHYFKKKICNYFQKVQ